MSTPLFLLRVGKSKTFSDGLLQLAGSTGGAGTEPGGTGYSAAHLSGSSDVIAGGFDNSFVDLSVTLSGQVANDVSTLTVSLTYDYWV